MEAAPLGGSSSPSLIKKSNQICRHEKMVDWAYTYGKDSNVYDTITHLISDEEKHYRRLKEIIDNSCSETHKRIVKDMGSLECGCE